MIAREWKAKCPLKHKEGFISYLRDTGLKETSSLHGFIGAQILNREFDDEVEIVFITYWESLECIKAFSGEDISVAKLYPEDSKYELKPDLQVTHYQVVENKWVKQANNSDK
jgi:heme-degrading monooxygenase HmoA